MAKNSLSRTKDESRKSAINIANNLVQHDSTKHIETEKFFIKEKLDSGILKLSQKGLGPVCLSRLCDKMGLVDIFLPS